MIKEYCNGRPA